MGNKINLKSDDGWKSNYFSGTDNTLQLSPCKNKYKFDLNLGRYRGSKFQNPPFYLHFLADTSPVKFVYTYQKYLGNEIILKHSVKALEDR